MLERHDGNFKAVAGLHRPCCRELLYTFVPYVKLPDLLVSNMGNTHDFQHHTRLKWRLWRERSAVDMAVADRIHFVQGLCGDHLSEQRELLVDPAGAVGHHGFGAIHQH